MHMEIISLILYNMYVLLWHLGTKYRNKKNIKIIIPIRFENALTTSV